MYVGYQVNLNDNVAFVLYRGFATQIQFNTTIITKSAQTN